MIKKLIFLNYSLFIIHYSLSSAPLCNAEPCPLNQNAIVWENDRFGAYIYGPGNHHCWNGIDIFNKSIPGSAAVAWSQDPKLNDFFKHPNIHDDRGEGMDNFTMGAGRGVGAVALWADGEWKTYAPYEKYEIIHTGDDYVEFKLVFPAFSALGKMTYHITMKKGEDFFCNEVSFEHPGRFNSSWRVGPGLDLEPKRDHKGDIVEEKGRVSIFEDPKGKDGSSMFAILAQKDADVEMLTDMQNCRVIGFKKPSFTYYAGAGWSKAGHFPTAGKWHLAVNQFWYNLNNIRKEEK